MTVQPVCTGVGATAQKPSAATGSQNTGQAVYTATRIEGLCKELGRNVLLSGDFAALCEGAVEPLGSFALKGLATAQPVFSPLQDPRTTAG